MFDLHECAGNLLRMIRFVTISFAAIPEAAHGTACRIALFHGDVCFFKRVAVQAA